MSSNCPVCRCIFYKPRLYPSCGHSVCSHCMRDCDKFTDRYMHSAPLYRCPVCRSQTLVPWHKRTRNIALEGVCEESAEYANRAAEIGDVDPEEETFDEDVDLAKLSSSQQDGLVLQLYEEIMPCLYQAAKEGRSHLVVDDLRVVQDLHRAGDAFSNYLFDRNNIYRVTLTSQEATFHFSRKSIRIRNDFINSAWLNPTEEETLSEVSLPSQSSSSIFSRISSMIDHVERSTSLPPPPPIPSQ